MPQGDRDARARWRVQRTLVAFNRWIPLASFSVPIKSFRLSPTSYCESGVAESALGKNLTCFDRYMMSRMCLAVITAGRKAFFACFSLHLYSPRFLRGSHTSCLSCGVWAAQVKPKSEAKASTDDFNAFALPSRLQNAVIRVYGELG